MKKTPSQNEGKKPFIDDGTLRFATEQAQKYLRRYGITEADKEDIVQTVVLTYIKKWKDLNETEQQDFENKDRLRRWIVVASRYSVLNLLRKTLTQSLEANPDLAMTAIDTLADVSDALQSKEALSALHVAIRSLGPKDRDLLELHMRGETSVRIATKLQLHPAAVRKRLERIRDHLFVRLLRFNED